VLELTDASGIDPGAIDMLLDANRRLATPRRLVFEPTRCSGARASRMSCQHGSLAEAMAAAATR
jgi:hypothetical protein